MLLRAHRFLCCWRNTSSEDGSVPLRLYRGCGSVRLFVLPHSNKHCFGCLCSTMCRHKKEKKRDKERDRKSDKERVRDERENSTSKKKKSRDKEREREREREKDRERERERDRKSDGEKGDVKVSGPSSLDHRALGGTRPFHHVSSSQITRDYDEEEQGYDSAKEREEGKESDYSATSPRSVEGNGNAQPGKQAKVNGAEGHHGDDMDVSD